MESVSVTRMEINLDNLLHNYRSIARQVAPAEVVPVVKSEAYGHGAVAVSRALQSAGCRHLAVAMVDEGRQLRQAGISGEIMVLGVTMPQQFAALAEHDLTPSLPDVERIAAWAALARALGRRLPYHLKLDIGLGRLGFLPEQREQALQAARAAKGDLNLRGIHSHLSYPEGSAEHNQREFARYQQFCDPFLAAFPEVRRHLAASQAVLRHPQMYFDLVRVGGLIYGFAYDYPNNLDLRPVLTYRTEVGQVKTLPAGWGIGYDLEHIVQQPTKVALLPLGWADGVGSTHVGSAGFLVRGQWARLVGICTDFAMLDVSNLPEVAVGDEVVLVGEQGALYQTVMQLAKAGKVSASQLLGRTALRVPRIYIQNGEPQCELSILSPTVADMRK